MEKNIMVGQEEKSIYRVWDRKKREAMGKIYVKGSKVVVFSTYFCPMAYPEAIAILEKTTQIESITNYSDARMGVIVFHDELRNVLAAVKEVSNMILSLAPKSIIHHGTNTAGIH